MKETRVQGTFDDMANTIHRLMTWRALFIRPCLRPFQPLADVEHLVDICDVCD